MKFMENVVTVVLLDLLISVETLNFRESKENHEPLSAPDVNNLNDIFVGIIPLGSESTRKEATTV